jgi:SAM-dependent methyltransferase
MEVVEQRKIAEAEFHNRLRDHNLSQQPELEAHLTSNRKWYSIARRRNEFVRNYLQQRCPGARSLDYACGDGDNTLFMATAGADATGIDISDVSVANAQRKAASRGLRASFAVMDCESLDFADSTFDIIYVGGVLHHLDLKRAYPELARVLKPSGSVLCVEALAHNPVFQSYRRMTPHLRTEYEAKHILGRRDVMAAKQFFDGIEWRFFYLTSLLAVPFRKTALFSPLLSTLEVIDSAVLSVPPICWWAWQIAFVLSQPKR